MVKRATPRRTISGIITFVHGRKGCFLGSLKSIITSTLQWLIAMRCSKQENLTLHKRQAAQEPRLIL